jgi:pyruvate formate lyase activating enzyme
MSAEAGPPQLEARSPFELRVNLGRDVPEATVKEALASGDMGFLHSFTTGSTVDGPGVRVVAWTTGCMWRCLYCHNPDTWNLIHGIPVTLQKATDELRKYRVGLKAMAGGFTLSGGEPLMQHRFAARLMAAADAELESIDLVLLDIKGWDAKRHERLTGMEIGPTLEFARRLAQRHRPIWVRFVLVPGLTDVAEDIDGLARFAAGLGNVERVDVLPFHQMGRFKWKSLKLDYTLETTEPPSQEVVEGALARFRAAGLKAV